MFHSGRGIIFVTIYYWLNVCTGQSCESGQDCKWSIQQGFVIKNESTWNLEHNVSGLSISSGGRSVFALTNGAKGILLGPEVPSSSTNKALCVTADIYVSKAGVRGTKVGGNISVDVSSDDKSQSDPERKNIKLSWIPQERWYRVQLKFGSPSKSFRVRLVAALQNLGATLALANVSIDNSCTSASTTRCGTSDSFTCRDGCVTWDETCDLHSDCPDGSDEHHGVCASLPSWAYCTFEQDMCGWNNFKLSHDIQLDWTRHSGPTPTNGTGPLADHTLGNRTGHYMYIETSNMAAFDSAALSLVLPAAPENYPSAYTQHSCKLRFFYHIKGNHRPGPLEVYFSDLCAVKPAHRKHVLLWSRNGSLGDRWLYAKVDIPRARNRYMIHFRADVDTMGHGDIAIDDVSFSPECFGITHNTTSYLPSGNAITALNFTEFRKHPKEYCNIQPKEAVTPTIVTKQNVPDNLSNPTSEAMTRSDESPVKETLHKEPEKFGTIYIVCITAACVVVAIVMGSALLCIGLKRRKERSLQAGHLEMASNASEDNCTTVPPQTSNFDMQLRCAVTELNPNYDFITAKYPEQQLREIPRNKLTLIKLIGQGAFGEVYEGSLKNMCRNVSELPVAVKTLPALSTEQAETDFLMEAVIISKFMHKNVVKCLGVCFEEHPRHIVLELLQGGDLKSYLRDSRPKPGSPCSLSMEDLVKLSLDVANGCRHLEEKHFVHRDIAARNCLLTSRDSDRVAKIADFGMSRDIYSADYYRKGGKTMLPIKWMPPEAFLDGVFTTKTDVWSFGVLLWEMFTLGYMPYPGQTNSDVMHYVASGGRLDPPENCPPRLNKIMIMCWNSVADIRPSFNDIIEHLDMCLQDPEVLDADLSFCLFPLSPDCFKDASTLAKSLPSSTVSSAAESPDLPTEESSVEFSRHMESQSREPLLLSSIQTV